MWMGRTAVANIVLGLRANLLEAFPITVDGDQNRCGALNVDDQHSTFETSETIIGQLVLRDVTSSEKNMQRTSAVDGIAVGYDELYILIREITPRLPCERVECRPEKRLEVFTLHAFAPFAKTIGVTVIKGLDVGKTLWHI